MPLAVSILQMILKKYPYKLRINIHVTVFLLYISSNDWFFLSVHRYVYGLALSVDVQFYDLHSAAELLVKMYLAVFTSTLFSSTTCSTKRENSSVAEIHQRSRAP